MKPGILFFTCILVISCIQLISNSFINDLQQDNVKGPAMRIITKTYLVNTEKPSKKLTQIIIDDFNRKGFVVQDSIIDINNKQITRSLFIYNKGKLTQIRTWLNNNLNGTTVFDEDVEGKLEKMMDYNSTGKMVQYYSNIKLNRFGLLVSASSFDAHGKVMNYYENNYKGTQLIGGFTKNAKGAITYRFNNTLNEVLDPSSFKETYITDNLTKSNIYNIRYVKVDKLKNWTEQIYYVGKKPVKITQRIISYYE